MIVEQRIDLRTDDGVGVALWKVSDPDAIAASARHGVFLTHGTFSDKRVCLGFAKYLAGYGHTCWVLEWRGHGNSQQDVRPFNFETVALFDVKEALTHLIATEQLTRLDCATHSGGGLVLTMCLARHPWLRIPIGRTAMFACQTCHAGFSRPRRLLLGSSKLASRLVGGIPGKRLGLGIQDETYFTMQQWFDWNLKQRFNGQDGFDYLAAMETLALPVLAVFGGQDRLIAPPLACRRHLAAFGQASNRELYCARPNGFSRDFGHADVMHSSAAKDEIWPTVRAWLEQPAGR